MLANSLAASGVLVSPLDACASSAPSASSAGAAPGRRIVKAKVKAPSASTGMTVPAPGGFHSIPDDDIDDSTGSSTKKQHLPPVMSPKASTEMLEESLEQSRMKRLDSTRKHQKSSRDKAVEERRKSLPKNADGGSGDQAGVASDSEEEKKKPKPQANPFSKFLSAFSVDAARPDHKRPYELGSSDVDQDSDSVVKGVGGEAEAADVKVTAGVQPSVTSAKLDAVRDSKKRPKLDQSEAATDSSKSLDSSSKTTTSIIGYEIDLTPAMSWYHSLKKSAGDLPPWVGIIGAATAVASAAVAVMVMMTKNKSKK